MATIHNGTLTRRDGKVCRQEIVVAHRQGGGYKVQATHCYDGFHEWPGAETSEDAARLELERLQGLIDAGKKLWE